MAAEITLASAFLVGLLGSTHCVGMCGGIVGALSLGARTGARGSRLPAAIYVVAYNVGRLASYGLAGAIAGFLGARLLDLVPIPETLYAARLISGGFMIALGLHLSGWWTGLSVLERFGGRLWRRIEPRARGLLPVTDPAKALLVGMVWGWLPCGMVYAALTWSLVAGSAVEGSILMLAFGAGTLPMLLALGGLTRWFGERVRSRVVRRTAAVFVLLLGIVTLLKPFPTQPGHEHAAGATTRTAASASSREGAGQGA